MPTKRMLLGLVVVMALLLPSPVQAECSGFTSKNAFAFETVTVGATAIGFTQATYLNANAALVSITAANVRFREDGTAPTTTAGHTVTAGQSIQICGTTNIRNFLAIRDDAVDAEAAVTYYR